MIYFWSIRNCSYAHPIGLLKHRGTRTESFWCIKMSTLGCVSVDTCFSFCFCGHSTLTTFSLSLLMIAVVAPPPRTDVISCAALLWSPQLLAIPPSSGDWSIFVGHDECIGGAAAQSIAATVREVGKGSQEGPEPLQVFHHIRFQQQQNQGL